MVLALLLIDLLRMILEIAVYGMTEREFLLYRMTILGLAAAGYGSGRDGITEALSAYLRDRVRRGRLGPLPHVELTARWLLETLATWAVHRRRDPAPTSFREEEVRDTVVQLLCRALAAG